jgi:hypothetical protein
MKGNIPTSQLTPYLPGVHEAQLGDCQSGEHWQAPLLLHVPRPWHVADGSQSNFLKNQKNMETMTTTLLPPSISLTRLYIHVVHFEPK